MRAAINIAGQQKPMPVYRGVNVERILDRHLHLIAAAHTDHRSKYGCGAAIGPRRLAAAPKSVET